MSMNEDFEREDEELDEAACFKALIDYFYEHPVTFYEMLHSMLKDEERAVKSLLSEGKKGEKRNPKKFNDAGIETYFSGCMIACWHLIMFHIMGAGSDSEEKIKDCVKHIHKLVIQAEAMNAQARSKGLN